MAVRRLVAAVVAVPILVVSVLTGWGTQGVQAAGNAQLLVNVVAVDPATGTPITALAPGQAVGFRVEFSCLTEACENASVTFESTQLDPNHDYYRLLVQSGFTAPLSGGTVSGSAVSGYTVSLGDLPAGASGQFMLEYSLAPRPGDRPVQDPPRSGEYNGWAVSNFPDGFEIVQMVTATADTAIEPIIDTTAPVVWHNVTPDPAVGLHMPGTSLPADLETDRDYTYSVTMGSGCMQSLFNAVWGRVARPLPALCASDYTVTHQLPPGAELVDAAGSPTVSGSVATGLVLTWDAPEWTTPRGANNGPEAGWVTTDAVRAGSSKPRSVTIRFPRENLAPAGAACNYEVQTGAWSVSASVTYISMPGEAGEVKTASTQSPARTLRCVEPFAKALADPKGSTFDGRRARSDVSPIVVPAGDGENVKEWVVTVANQANVTGVAVVTDNTLDQPDAPVFQIVASQETATIAWTATDGTTTTSGMSTGTADAPDGFRFVTAVVTSDELTRANQFEDETGRNDFTVRYRYRVTADAPVGESRTNTATAVMTYPDYPQLADVPLTPRPHTIVFTEPFQRASIAKSASGAVVDGAHQQTLPSTGWTARDGNSPYWRVEVYNTGNVAGVPVVTDTDLGNPEMPVWQVFAQHRLVGGTIWYADTGTLEYRLDDGTTGTATLPYTAPSGRRIVSATVTGPEMEGPNSTPGQTSNKAYAVVFRSQLSADSVPGTEFDNAASLRMEYPNYELAPVNDEARARVRVLGPAPVITATMGVPVIAEGATRATTASDVTFTVGGSTARVPRNRDINPQYVFVAPEGWHITPGSARFPAGSIPPGVTYQYRTVQIDGDDREVVVASWPAGTVFGENTTWPTMSVIARPTASVPAGTTSMPRAFIGTTGDVLASDVFTRAFTDAPDLDGGADSTERFSEADNTNRGVPVAAVAAMQVLKEICFPDATRPDGCRWFADPDNRVGVPPNSTSIKYRISVTNTGNSPLSDIVGYDILPYPGDTGTSDPTGGVARGSTFQETIQSVSAPTNAATVTYSASTQPCRPEVDATVPGCANDWSGTSTGAQALRLERTGELASGESFSLEYTAGVNGVPGFGAVACNSFAVRAAGLENVSEPANVCASVEETDLQIVAGTPEAQAGRPAVLPFTVTNLGGAPSTQGEARVTIPAGLEVTSFTPAGWTCTAVDGAGQPVFGTATGPATLTCAPTAPLMLDEPRPLDIPVRAIDTRPLVIPGDVSGRMFDGNVTNNNDEMQFTATAAPGDISVSKDDGVTTAAPGDELTYTIEVGNPLDFETLTGGTLADTLPFGVAFVAASDGGVESDGTVSWSLPDIAGRGSLTRTVTVRVLSTIAVAQIENRAVVSAPDPANPAEALTGAATDTDTVITRPELTLTKGSIRDVYTAVGDTVDYTFAFTNTGDVSLHDVVLHDPLPGLSTIAYTWPATPGVLAPGDTATATAMYTITQADVDAGNVANTARVTAATPGGDPVEVTDTHTVTGNAVPHLTVTKQAAPATVAAAGDVVTYAVTLVNDGPATLQNVAVTDPLRGLSTFAYAWPGDIGVLAPGEQVAATATYTVTQADVDAGQVLNTATGDAATPGGISVSGEASAVVTIPATPAIEVLKDVEYADGTIGLAGDTLHYSFTVTNTGNVTLTGVTIDDPLPGLSSLASTWPGVPGTLAPGQVATATADYVVTQADVDGLVGVTNTATVTGTDPNDDPVGDEGTVTIDTPATSGVQVAKTATLAGGNGRVMAGDVIEYRFAVTNLGGVTLHDVVLGDPMPGLSDLELSWPGDPGVLAPGDVLVATARYTVAQTDIDRGNVVNTATVVGVTPGDETVADDDTATVVLAAVPELLLEKSAADDGSVWEVGDTVTYQFALTNTGNVTETDVRIIDLMPGLSAITYTWPDDQGVLAPGEIVRATAEYQLTGADVDRATLTNTATATTTHGLTATDTATLRASPPPATTTTLPPVTSAPPATPPTTGTQPPPIPQVPITPSPPTMPPPALPTTGGSSRPALVLASLVALVGFALVIAVRRRRPLA